MILFCVLLVSGVEAASGGRPGVPDGFVLLTDAVPDVVLEVRYAGTDNFVGCPLDGYLAPVAYASERAAEALGRAARILRKQGYGIKIFDAYRPKSAVAHMVRWSEDASDRLNAARYYPEVDKADLIRKGYISSNSAHARGSAVDLTLVEIATGREVDMGSPFDFFGEISHHGARGVSPQQAQNRQTLRSAMASCGFLPARTEWWHYRLKDEPFKTAFDFPVAHPGPEPSPAFLDQLPIAPRTHRLVVVLGSRTNPFATVLTYEKRGDKWIRQFRTEGFVGAKGTAPARKEGSMQTPEGVYDFGPAFGTADDPGAAKPYTKLTPDDLWVDDPSSRYYNRWVKRNQPDRDWRSAEELARETEAYRYAIATSYNTDPVVPGAGSAIFLHCSTGGPTAGCISVPQQAMIHLLRFIDDRTQIVISGSENVR